MMGFQKLLDSNIMAESCIFWSNTISDIFKQNEITCVLISIEVQPMTHSHICKEKIMLCVYAGLVDS